MAIDLETQWLEARPSELIEVRPADITVTELPPAGFRPIRLP